MHALTIAKGWGPSASRVSTIALGRPRRPSAAWQRRPGGGRGALGCGGRSRAARGPLAGQARRAGAGAPREGPRPPARAGAARDLPTSPPRGPRRLRADGGCGGSGGSEARPKLAFPDLAGPHLLESGNEHSLDSGDVQVPPFQLGLEIDDPQIGDLFTFRLTWGGRGCHSTGSGSHFRRTARCLGSEWSAGRRQQLQLQLRPRRPPAPHSAAHNEPLAPPPVRHPGATCSLNQHPDEGRACALAGGGGWRPARAADPDAATWAVRPPPRLAWTGRSGAFNGTNVRRAAVPHRFVSYFLEVSRVLSNALGTLGIDSARVTQRKPRGVCAP